MFKVNNKDMRTAAWHLFASVSIVDFEQVCVSWAVLSGPFKHLRQKVNLTH